MKALNALVLPLIAAAGLCVVAADVQAQRHGGSSGYRGGGHSGASTGRAHSGVSGGRWHGGGASYGHGYRGGHGGRYYGGHRGGYYYGSPAYWGWWGAAIAAPFLWGSYYGWPYYGPSYGYWGPGNYGGYSPDPYDREGVAGFGPPHASNERELTTTEVPAHGPGAPTQMPLYLNYCEATKAYYPKVGSCASGWQMHRPQYN